MAGLIDVKGALYGTTVFGGAYNDGTVFSVTTTGTESVLYSFRGSPDGLEPRAGLVDVNGTLYGTTYEGGIYGGGTVFKIDAGTNNVTTLFTFDGGVDGGFPYSLIADASGNLYGTAQQGGADGYGTVFELSPVAVPEPSSFVLAALAGVALLFFARLRASRLSG